MSMLRAKYPKQKPVMIITDYPILTEIQANESYSAASHLQMLSALHKVGIKQSDCSLTYLSYHRPSEASTDWSKDIIKHKNIPEGETYEKLEHQKDCYLSPEVWKEFSGLLEEIKKVQPKLIIVIGKWSLFFLTGEIPLNKVPATKKDQRFLGPLVSYRASLMRPWAGFQLPNAVILPLLPPVTKQRQPEMASIMQLDYGKAGELFKKLQLGKTIEELFQLGSLTIGTDFEKIITWLDGLIAKLEIASLFVSADIETKFGAIVDCIGFAYRDKEAITSICIPFASQLNASLWSFDQEWQIHDRIAKVLTHENCQLIGQNWSYDAQFLWKFWLLPTHTHMDTMIFHHVMYNSMKKDLGFLASVYCDNFSQWKFDQTLEKIAK